MKTYNRTNFFKHTYCIFHEVNPENLPAEVPDYISKSQSKYYFTAEGVFRKSNHWGRAANCRWKLISREFKSQTEIVAYAKWTDFFANNETEKLFFIQINESKEVTFHHKQEINFQPEFILRTAVETSKRIKLLKEVLETENWCKYLNFDNFEELEKQMINELIFTNNSFQEIKKKLNGKI